MDSKIQSVNFDADSKLKEKIEKKIAKFTTYHDRIVDTEVYLKLDNVVHHIKDKVAEIKVNVPGKTYFTKSTSKSIEESFESAFTSMVNKLKTEKEKQNKKHLRTI